MFSAQQLKGLYTRFRKNNSGTFFSNKLLTSIDPICSHSTVHILKICRIKLDREIT